MVLTGLSRTSRPSSRYPQDRFPRELRHLWGPIGEAGDNQPRLPASDNLRTSAPGLLKSSKGHQDRCHTAEWPVLQLTTENWRAPLSHRLFCPDAMGCSRGSLSFTSGFTETKFCGSFFPRGSPNRQNRSQRLRPVQVMKTSSSVPSRRLREFTLLWADPVVALIGTSAAHAPSGPIRFGSGLSHQRNRSRINASLTRSLPSSPEVEMFRSTQWGQKFLPPGLKFFLLGAEFPRSQSELSHRFAFGPVSGPQQLCHCRSDQLVLFHGGQSSWFVACLKLHLLAPRLESLSHQNLNGQRP